MIVDTSSNLRFSSFTCDANDHGEMKNQTISLLSSLSEQAFVWLPKIGRFHPMDTHLIRSEMISEQKDTEGNLQRLSPENTEPHRLFSNVMNNYLHYALERAVTYRMLTICTKIFFQEFYLVKPFNLYGNSDVLMCYILLWIIICR